MRTTGIQDIHALSERICDAVAEYIQDKDSYTEAPVLAIDPDTLDLDVMTKDDVPSCCESVAIDTLIRPDENGRPEPDNDATWDLANKYLFIE